MDTPNPPKTNLWGEPKLIEQAKTDTPIIDWMRQRKIVKKLAIITTIGWAAVASSFLFPSYTYSDEAFWVWMIFAIPILSAVLVACYFVAKPNNKEIMAGQNNTKKTISVLGIFVMAIFTAIVSFFVMLFIWLDRNPPHIHS